MCEKNAVKKGLILSLGMVILILMLASTNTLASLCLADLDGDGKVNYSDLKIMNSAIGSNDCILTPCQADLNVDGRVNTLDRDMLFTEFGKVDCIVRKEDKLEEDLDEPQLKQGERFNPDGGRKEKEDISYDDRMDKNLVADTVQSATRFKNHGNGTITDPKNGLMWTKDANLISDTLLFHQARNYIREMNEGKHANFGFTDWRIPTLRELQSLIEYAEFSSKGHVLPSGHPFQKVQSLKFHNSTSPTYLSKPDHSWFVDAYCRIVGHNAKFCFGFVWPVRGDNKDHLK